MEAPGVRIVRPVSTESLRDLRIVRRVDQEFPRHEIQKRDMLRVSLVENGELLVRKRAWQQQMLAKTLASMPETGTERLTLPVDRVDYFGTSIGRRSLAIVLDDPEGIFHEERRFYTDQLPRWHFKSTQPHISLGNVFPFNATTDLSNWVEERLPETVTLSPVRVINRPQSAKQA